jgi:L-amino acid N-acyltransferase YncA
MVRFDLADDQKTAEVSINLNPGWRGHGVGEATLLAGLAALRSERGAMPELVAIIRPENTASVRLFERAGFVLARTTGEFAYFRREAETR